LSDLNAYLGIIYQHFTYLSLTPQQINSAIPLPTVGDTLTHYYMIPAANLPLLDPLRLLPIIGDPLADLLQPDLTVLVNLGYGSITNGWSPGPANVPTPFGLFPTNINLIDVLTALANGARRGIADALNDLRTPTLLDTSSLSGILAALHTFGLTNSNNPSLLDLLAAVSTYANGDVPVTSTGGILDTLTSAVSTDLAVGLPIADTAVALGVTLPAYDAQLFASQLQAGNLLNAIGLPIAADVALAPFALLSGIAEPILEAAATTVTELAGLAQTATASAATTGSTANTNAQRGLPTATGANTGTGASSGTGASIGADNVQGTSDGTGMGAKGGARGSTGSGDTLKADGRDGADGISATASVADAGHGSSSCAGSNRESSKPGLAGAPGAGGTGGGARTLGAGTVGGTAAGASTAVTVTSGSSSSTHSTAGTGLHRAHG